MDIAPTTAGRYSCGATSFSPGLPVWFFGKPVPPTESIYGQPEGLVGGEDINVLTHSSVSSGSVIAASGHDSDALQAQFHPFIALTLLSSN